jgi:hypothetical protein
MCSAEPVEQDDLVEPVEEFGRKCPRTISITCGSTSSTSSSVGQAGQILAAEVRGQDDDRVGEIDRAALAVGQRPSSSTWSSMLNTSPCAFSTSSNSTT